MDEESKSLVERKRIIHAVKILKELYKKWLEEAEKKPLFSDVGDIPLFLQVSLKKIPNKTNIQMIPIPLPHSLLTDTSEICLITGDLDKRNTKAEIEPTVEHYKDLLRKHDIKCITEVIPLRQLRTDYKPYEAKRQLLGAYDVFIADQKIANCLPKVLGKFFFKKRKFPQQVCLRRQNLKDHVEKTLSKTVLFVTGRGNSCATQVARLGLSTKKMVDNIMAAVNILAERIPGSWDNVSGLHLKTAKSEALPIYMSLESGNDVKLENKYTKVPEDPQEITTLKKIQVKVYPSGIVDLVPVAASSDSESDSGYEDKLLANEKRKRKKIKSINRKKANKNKLKLEGEGVKVKAMKTKKQKPNPEDEAIVKESKEPPAAVKRIPDYVKQQLKKAELTPQTVKKSNSTPQTVKKIKWTPQAVKKSELTPQTAKKSKQTPQTVKKSELTPQTVKKSKQTPAKTPRSVKKKKNVS